MIMQKCLPNRIILEGHKQKAIYSRRHYYNKKKVINQSFIDIFLNEYLLAKMQSEHD